MKKEIRQIVEKALLKYCQKNNIEKYLLPDFNIEYPKTYKFGDYSTNLAMQLAPVFKKNPLEIAKNLKDYLEETDNKEGGKEDKYFQKIEVIAPGFINFFITEKYLTKKVLEILEVKNKYGTSNFGQGKKVQVEFISANPTGPLHLGNGRGGFFGDCLANILKFSGHEVKREYLLNDRGKQVDTLGESVIRRRLQEEGIKVDYPEDLYRGDYVKDLAKQIEFKNFKLSSISEIQKVKAEVKNWALDRMISNIKEIAENKCKIKFDNWFSEKSLYTGKSKEEIWQFLEEKDLIYKKDKAWWFKASLFGDEKDRVIVRSNGEPTYFFSDILYLQNRFKKRGFDKVIMIWGCDHHGDVQRVQAACEVLGCKGQLDIVLYQLVRLMLNGKELRMSKRKGTFVTLEELIDEVGIDVVRWFFLMYQVGSHMDFDLNLAKKKSEQNPVYYVQYAHARICSIIDKLPNSQLIKNKNIDNQYNHSSEFELIKELLKFPDLVLDVNKTYEIHKLPQYALDISRKFHKFYNTCRVIDNDEINFSRLALIKAVKIVLANCLKLMGISAPEKM